MAKILLAGFDLATGQDLAGKLSQLGHETEIQSFSALSEKAFFSDPVFIFGDDARGMSLLKRVRKTTAELPVVVVSRMDDASHWIGALEAGATDYCVAHAERQQLRWIVDSALSTAANAHAFAAA